MKSLYKLNWLNIKNNRYILLALLLIIYGFVLPIILSYQSAQEDMAYIWFMYLQKMLFIPLIIMVGYLYKPYVEIEYVEVIQSIHKRHVLSYIFDDMCLVQLFMLPFYCILIFNDYQIIRYIFIIILQFCVLMSAYQMISSFTHSTTVSLGLILCYILLFSLALNDATIGNIFINGPIEYLQRSYFIICLMIIIVSFVVSYVMQKYR